MKRLLQRCFHSQISETSIEMEPAKDVDNDEEDAAKGKEGKKLRDGFDDG